MEGLANSAGTPWFARYQRFQIDQPVRNRHPAAEIACGFQNKVHTVLGISKEIRRPLGVISSYHCKRRQARRDLHLHVDRAGLDPFKGYGRNPRTMPAPCSAIEGSGEPEGKSRTFREHMWPPDPTWCALAQRRIADHRGLSGFSAGCWAGNGVVRPEASVRRKVEQTTAVGETHVENLPCSYSVRDHGRVHGACIRPGPARSGGRIDLRRCPARRTDRRLAAEFAVRVSLECDGTQLHLHGAR